LIAAQCRIVKMTTDPAPGARAARARTHQRHPQEFTTYIKAQIARFAQVVKAPACARITG
jgi:hypothetical protein